MPLEVRRNITAWKLCFWPNSTIFCQPDNILKLKTSWKAKIAESDK